MLSLINPNPMNTEFLTLTLQDLEPLIAKSNCPCHIINPNKTRIILWKSQDDPDAYYLRIGIQKFISYPLKDKNKLLYWRFKSPEKQGVYSELSQKEAVPTAELSQEKTEAINHGSNANSNSS